MLKNLKIKKCKDCKYFKQVNIPTCNGKMLPAYFCNRKLWIQPLKLLCFKKRK